MAIEKDFARIVSQIKAELSSIGLLDPGPKPRRGINVIDSSGMTPGWVSISDEQGNQAFGPANQILGIVRKYVRQVIEEGKPLSERPESLWELARDFPCDPGGEMGGE